MFGMRRQARFIALRPFEIFLFATQIAIIVASCCPQSLSCFVIRASTRIARVLVPSAVSFLGKNVLPLSTVSLQMLLILLARHLYHLHYYHLHVFSDFLQYK